MCTFLCLGAGEWYDLQFSGSWMDVFTYCRICELHPYFNIHKWDEFIVFIVRAKICVCYRELNSSQFSWIHRLNSVLVETLLVSERDCCVHIICTWCYASFLGVHQIDPGWVADAVMQYIAVCV